MSDLQKLVKRRRQELIQVARQSIHNRSPETHADAQMRIRYLIGLEDRLKRREDTLTRPTLFIAYARKGGRKFFEKAREAAIERGFDVHDGFERQREANVLAAVRGAIALSDLFLAIMTPEIEISGQSPGKGKLFAPSIWVVEEKGIALGLNKPFRMLIHKRVHEDFWRRTTPEALHHQFGDGNFDEHLDECLGALMDRYEEVQLARLGIPASSG